MIKKRRSIKLSNGTRRHHKRKNKRNKSHKNKVNCYGGNSSKVVGKIYSNGCGHCVALEKPWQDVTNKLKGGNVVVKDIEASIMDDELVKLNNKYLEGKQQQVSLQGGFPTIYKIYGGTVSYYDGKRDTEPMLNWVNT